MSATARSARATTRPAGHPKTAPTTAGRPRRTPLHEVAPPAPAVAGTGIFSLVVVGILVGGMVMLLVLNTSLAQGAFEISALTSTQRDLAVKEQKLAQQVALTEAPEALQERARGLGMVPVASPVFLRLADGKVLGVPTPAQADPFSRLPSTGAPATSGTTSGTGSTATTPTPGAAPAKPATKPATTPGGDGAQPDPAPVVDGAVPDAPTATTRETR